MGIKNFLRMRLQKFLLKLLDAASIELAINQLKIKRCNESVTAGQGTFFYETARVFNFKKNKSLIKIGENTHIRGELLVFASGGSIELGSNSFIGEGTRIWSAENVVIGDNVLISHNCNISDTDSHEIDFKERENGFKNLIRYGHPSQKGNVMTKEIIIGNNVWISYNVSILKGVQIGEGAIVGAGSVVTRDIQPYTVVAGNPAEVIKSLK